MPRDRYTFDGLDSFEKRLRRVAAEVGYLVVWDRTDRKSEETLGRFDLTFHDALPYLEEARELIEDEPVGDELHDELDPIEGDSDGGLMEAFGPPAEPVREEPEAEASRMLGRAVGAADLAVAGGRWLRDIAARNMGGEPIRRFRVRAYTPKGTRVVDTGSFVCRDEDHEPELPVHVSSEAAVPDLRIPPPSFEHVEVGASSRGMRALGDYYAQWGQIVLGAVGQLQGVNNAMLGRMHRQLQESRDQVDQLVAAILNYRVAEAQLAENRRVSDRSDDARTELARQALHQLGEAARAFLVSKGMSPEMADTLGSLGQSPELAAALNDPDVKVLMQDPNNLKVLAGMLRQAGTQARVLRESAPPEPQPQPS